jgi:hypothetical protein
LLADQYGAFLQNNDEMMAGQEVSRPDEEGGGDEANHNAGNKSNDNVDKRNPNTANKNAKVKRKPKKRGSVDDDDNEDDEGSDEENGVGGDLKQVPDADHRRRVAINRLERQLDLEAKKAAGPHADDRRKREEKSPTPPLVEQSTSLTDDDDGGDDDDNAALARKSAMEVRVQQLEERELEQAIADSLRQVTPTASASATSASVQSAPVKRKLSRSSLTTPTTQQHTPATARQPLSAVRSSAGAAGSAARTRPTQPLAAVHEANVLSARHRARRDAAAVAAQQQHARVCCVRDML